MIGEGFFLDPQEAFMVVCIGKIILISTTRGGSMPHLYIEYTDNIKNEADIHELLEKANKTLLSHSDIIPAGGLSSRPFVLEDYLLRTVRKMMHSSMSR